MTITVDSVDCESVKAVFVVLLFEVAVGRLRLQVLLLRVDKFWVERVVGVRVFPILVFFLHYPSNSKKGWEHSRHFVFPFSWVQLRQF